MENLPQHENSEKLRETTSTEHKGKKRKVMKQEKKKTTLTKFLPDGKEEIKVVINQQSS